MICTILFDANINIGSIFECTGSAWLYMRPRTLANMGMIKLRKINHRGKDRLGLFFKYDSVTISEVKELPYRKYSKTFKCWHLPYNHTNLNRVLDAGLDVDLDELDDDILNPGLPIEVSYFIEEKAHELIGSSKPMNNKISADTLSELKTKLRNWQ